MRKVLIVSLGFFFFGCDNTGNNNENTTGDRNANESVEIGSGEEISPQLEMESDTNTRFDVDTISSSGSTYN